MSEPTRWGPPGHGAPPQPTAPHPHPTAPGPMRPPPPAAPDRTAFLPTTPIPTVRAATPPAPTRQAPRPLADEYHDGYGDADHGRYDDDPRDAPRARREPRRPRTRGQIFAGVVLLLALVVSALMYYLTYQTLASVDITAGDPLGDAGGQAASLVGVVFGALVVFVLAVIALVIARPKAIAGLGLAASLLLPVGALVLGLWYGGSVLRQNVESDIAQAGPEIAAQGAAAAADALVDELENRGIDAGPLRDLITSAVG